MLRLAGRDAAGMGCGRGAGWSSAREMTDWPQFRAHGPDGARAGGGARELGDGETCDKKREGRGGGRGGCSGEGEGGERRAGGVAPRASLRAHPPSPHQIPKESRSPSSPPPEKGGHSPPAGLAAVGVPAVPRAPRPSPLPARPRRGQRGGGWRWRRRVTDVLL